jgi:hypothetical protein
MIPADAVTTTVAAVSKATQNFGARAKIRRIPDYDIFTATGNDGGKNGGRQMRQRPVETAGPLAHAAGSELRHLAAATATVHHAVLVGLP